MRRLTFSKRLKAVDGGGGGHAGVARGGDGGERVHAVVFADQLPFHAALQGAVEEDVEVALGIDFAGGPAACAMAV